MKRDQLFQTPSLWQVVSPAGMPFNQPRVIIDQQTFAKLKRFVDLCEAEISGLGIIERQGNDFIIKDVYVLKQHTVIDGLHVELDPQAFNLFIYELAKNGGDTAGIKFQWHSHADAPAFFSPEDINTIAGYMNDYMISLVINKRGEYQCRLDLFKPFQLSLTTSLLVRVPPLDAAAAVKCQEDIDRNVIKTKSLLNLDRSKLASDIDEPSAILVGAQQVIEKEEKK